MFLKMSENSLLAKWNDAREKLDVARQAIDGFQAVVRELQEQHAKQMESLKLPAIPNLDVDAIRSFLQQPYLLMPRKENSWYVIVPRFIDMQVGWLSFRNHRFQVPFGFVCYSVSRGWQRGPHHRLDRLSSWLVLGTFHAGQGHTETQGHS